MFLAMTLALQRQAPVLKALAVEFPVQPRPTGNITLRHRAEFGGLECDPVGWKHGAPFDYASPQDEGGCTMVLILSGAPELVEGA
jgi:hypothetical protein